MLDVAILCSIHVFFLFYIFVPPTNKKEKAMAQYKKNNWFRNSTVVMNHAVDQKHNFFEPQTTLQRSQATLWHYKQHFNQSWPCFRKPTLFSSGKIIILTCFTALKLPDVVRLQVPKCQWRIVQPNLDSLKVEKILERKHRYCKWSILNEEKFNKIYFIIIKYNICMKIQSEHNKILTLVLLQSFYNIFS